MMSGICLTTLVVEEGQGCHKLIIKQGEGHTGVIIILSLLLYMSENFH